MQEFFVNFNYESLVQPALIIFGTLIVAKLIAFLIALIGKRIAKKTETDLDDEIIDSVKGPIFYTIVLTGIYLALRILLFQDLIDKITLPIFQTILVILWSVFLVKFTKLLFNHFVTVERIKFITKHTLPLFMNLSFVLIWAISIYSLFNVWSINMTAWLASAGVAGIAIGFAAKDTLANLISGVFILTDSPYKIGDWIVLDSGERGKVTHIGIRTTRMKNTDNMEVTVPNAVIGGSTLTNESGGDKGKLCRVRVAFGVAYGTDIDEVEKIVLKIAEENEHILTDHEPRVRFRLLGASSLDYELLFWLATSAKKGLVIHQMNRAIYKTFAEKNIEIPYTKQDLYIKEMPRR